MTLKIATLVVGSETPAGDGCFGALRCVINTPSGEKKAAVLKQGPLEQIIAEAFCALLLKAWGLNVPDPYLISFGDGFGFASSDIGYPNLKQSLGLSNLPDGPIKQAVEAYACKLAVDLNSMPAALAADEAIGNRDRNLGNILWDGSEEAWIDHAFCLYASESQKDYNKLAIMAEVAGKSDEIARAAIAQALVLDQNAIKEAGESVDKHLGDTKAAEYVASRIQTLTSKIISRFPKQNQLI